jgi:hypothetical protein
MLLLIALLVAAQRQVLKRIWPLALGVGLGSVLIAAGDRGCGAVIGLVGSIVVLVHCIVEF